MDPYDLEQLKKLTYFRMNMLQAEIRMQGMMAENVYRKSLGQSVAYGEEAFCNLIEELGIHHNAFYSMYKG